MPQMSPLMWLILFSFFSLLMLITTTKNYFNHVVASPDSPSTPKVPSQLIMMNWKW